MSPYPKYLEDTLEIMIENGDSHYINIKADCQEAYAYIDKTIIIPEDIFLTVPIYNNFRIINPSNLPINFKWQEIHKPDEMNIRFFPQSGTIKPRSYQEMRFQSEFFLVRKVDDLFTCHIEEMEVPIGIIIKGEVVGLEISYEITEDTIAQLKSTRITDTMSLSSITSKTSIKNRKTFHIRSESEKIFNGMSLRHLKVNRPYYFSFIIKNLSGIETQYEIRCKNYQPGQEKTLKSEFGDFNSNNNSNNISNLDNNNSSTKSLAGIKRSLSKLSTLKKNQNNSIKHPHMLLSDAHEEINFTSALGYEFTKMRQVEKDAIMYLSSKKGVSLVIDPKQGKLNPYNEVMITVAIFNECVGDFQDDLIVEIKGLANKIFPVNLRIRGNPLQLSPFQPGINYEADPPNLTIGSVLTRVNKIEKVFKLLNTGSNILSVDWKVYDYNDVLYPKRDIFNIKINENRNNTFSLVYHPVEPEEFPEGKKHFEIFPKKCMINPKAVRDFMITFNTDKPGLNSALIVGYPKFEDENSSKVKLSELTLKVDGIGVTPQLVVDKRKTMDDRFIYKFYYHSYGLSPNPKRSIILINKEKINLKIKIHIEGPFKLTKSEPLEATIGNNQFNLIPNSNLKLDIKFQAPDVDNESQWPMTLLNERNGMLTVLFENNDFVEYDLTAMMRRPRLRLSTSGNELIESGNFVYFGFVNCESFRLHNLYLTNETEVEAKWTINYVKSFNKKVYGHGTLTKEEKEDLEKVDDPEVFHFNITQGNIFGPTNFLVNVPVCAGVPLKQGEIGGLSLIDFDNLLKPKKQLSSKFDPIKIDVMFKPKKNIFYKSRFRILVETGNTIDFILKGNGSYLEEHIHHHSHNK